MGNISFANEIEIIDEIIARLPNKTLHYTLSKENGVCFSVTITDGKDTLTAKDFTRDEQSAIEFFERIASGRVGPTSFFEVVDDFLAED